MATTVIAGLLAQWPMGSLSDKIRRSRLIRINTVLLGGVVLCMAILAFKWHFCDLSSLLLLAFWLLPYTRWPQRWRTRT